MTSWEVERAGGALSIPTKSSSADELWGGSSFLVNDHDDLVRSVAHRNLSSAKHGMDHRWITTRFQLPHHTVSSSNKN
jgi:hypothetical protein